MFGDKGGAEEAREPGKEHSQIKIVLQGGQDNRTTVLAKKSTKVGKLLSAYCKERHVNAKEYRLVFCGKVMNEGEEVGCYNVRDSDVIEVVASQTGGFF